MKTIKAYLVAALVAVGLNFVAQATVMRAELSLASLSENARLKPIAVKLATNSPVGFSYADCMPGHMAFIGADGKELPFEVATWNTSGESVIWVRPLTTDDTITLTYGAEVTPTKAATDVWEGEYSGVWHFDQFDISDTTTRSQASSPNSTAEEGIDAHIADKTGTLTNQEGRFGAGVQTADASSSGGGLWMNDPGDDSPLDGGAYFTISGWFKHHDADCSWDHVFYKRSRENNATDGSNPYNGGFAIEVANAGPAYPLTTQGDNGGWPHFDTTINAKGKWVYLTFVYDGAKCTTYADGKSVLVTTTNFGAASNNNAPLAVGNNSNYEINGGVDSPWRGFVDEVRFSKGAKSAEWIAAEYAAMMATPAWVGCVTVPDAPAVLVDANMNSYPGATQVSPTYGLHTELSGETELTCPAYVAVEDGKVRQVCTGWTRYDINGDVVDSGTTHQVKLSVDKFVHLVWNWVEYKDADAKAYVQDDLLAVWDCADLEHLDSTGWTDTSGRYEFVFEGSNKGNITFDEKGVYFPDNAAAYLDQSGAAATFDAAADGTLEIVFVQTAKNSSANMILQNNNSYPLGMIVDGSERLQTRVGNISAGIRGWSFGVNLDAVRMVSIDYTGAVDQGNNALIDGRKREDSTYLGDTWSHKGFTGTVLGGYRNDSSAATYHGGWSFIGKILSVRLYSKKLTPEQKQANFVVDKWRFDLKDELKLDAEHGTIYVHPTKFENAELTAQLQAVPDEGYEFVSWTDPEMGTANPAPFTYTVGTETRVEATFQLFKRPVTFAEPADATLAVTVGGATIPSGDEFEYGTEVVAVATPSEYAYDPIPTGWTQVGGSTAIARTYTVGYDPVEITLPVRHVLTLNTVGEGAVTGGATRAYDENTVLTLTAAPATGSHFAGWTGAVESNELTIEVTMDAAKTLTATFAQNEADQHVVTFAGGANAVVLMTVDGEPIASGAAVSKDKTVVVTATPNENYAYETTPEGWTKDPATGAISQEVTVGTEDVNIVVPDAVAQVCTLTLTQPVNGEISSSASGVVQKGATVTLTASASVGYEFASWTDDAEGSENPLVVTMDVDKTIGANIVRIYRKATFTAPDNTTVIATVDGEEIKSEDLVEYGKSVLVTITPVGEYEYLTVPQNWSAGEVKGTITRTFKFLDQAQTFDLPAVTAIPRFEVVIDDTCENGTISGTAGSYLRDEVVTLTPVPDEGYVFEHWTGVDNGLQLVHPLELTGYSDKRTITVGAVFRKATSIDMAYEQDGLLTMWDCRDKDHIDETGWTDVSGRFKFAFEGSNKGNIAFDEKGVYFPDNAAAYLDQSGAAATFDAAADGTLEIVFVQTAKNSWGDMILQNNNSYPLGMIIDGSGLQTHVGYKSGRGWNFDVNLDAVRMVSIDYTGANDQATNALIDGKARSDSTPKSSWSHSGFTGTVLGGYRNDSSAATYHEGGSFIGKILSVRLYSKKLTPEQKLKNYQSDLNRFVKKSRVVFMFY